MEKRKYKLILIDDEFFVMKGLRETIDWESLNIEIVAECTNGAQGLDAIHKLKPDLVISDIRMPILDGLTLAKTLAEERFDCAVIIYSGYSDFEYVSSALEYGVTRYLLKPIENHALVDKIKEVLFDLETERKKAAALEQHEMGLPLLKETLIRQLLEGQDIQSVQEKLERIDIGIPAMGIVIECTVLQNYDAEFEKLYRSLMDSLNGFVAIGQIYEQRFVVITDLLDGKVLYNCIAHLLKRAECRSACRMAVGISRPYGTERTLQTAYAEAKAQRENILFSTVNHISMAGTDDVGEGSVATNRYKQVVIDAIGIIMADYGKKLSVKKVADRLFVSESHLMHVFKESLGKTFGECLTEYRIIQAKEMLAEGKLRIGEISARIGYSDVQYFGRIFKDATGMSPSEYAESVRSTLS